MAALSWLTRRQLPQVGSHFSRVLKLVRPQQYLGGLPVRRVHWSQQYLGGLPVRRVHWSQQYLGGLPVRRVHWSARSRVGDKGPWVKSRMPEQHYQLTELDKADAMMLRKSHETGFLSWFRNGLVATGIGVIAFVQSEVGREAGYAFFTLGGVCVSFGAASYVISLVLLRRMMMLSVPAMLLHVAVVTTVELFWLCAVSLYIGRLEVEIIHDEEEEEDHEEECQECRERRERRGYRGSHDNRHHADDSGKGQDK